MKNKDGSLLEIMQDPLLTMVAIILFGTLWIIIPGGRGAADGVDSQKLRSQLVELEQVLQVLEQQIFGTETRIAAEEKKQTEWKKSALLQERQVTADIDRAKKKIGEVNIALRKKEKELSDLSSGLDGAEEYKPEVDLIDDLQRRIDDLEREIYKKGKVLGAVDSPITDTSLEDGVGASHPEKIKEKTVKVLRAIDLEETRVKALQEKREGLFQVLKTKRGTGEYSAAGTSGKEALAFEADGGKLFLIDHENYEVLETGYMNTKNGKVRARNIGRKKTVTGDTRSMLNKGSSIFRKTLSQASSDKKYIMFLVRKDSYALFLNARLIAEQAGFRVGWMPFEDGPIVASERAENDAGPLVR